MESKSEANRINCSKSSAKLLRVQWPELSLDPRGVITVKGKGEMACYLVNENSSGPSTTPGEVLVTMMNNSAMDLDLDASAEHAARQGSKKGTSCLPSETSATVPEESMQEMSDHWVDLTAKHSFDEEANVFDHAVPEAAPAPPQNSGTWAKRIIGKGEKWLRLNEEVAFVDELWV